MSDCIAVVAAAGSGRRCGVLKQFAPLYEKTVLWHALSPLAACRQVRQIRVVVADGFMQQAQQALAGCADNVVILPVGGDTRAASVYNGLIDCDETTWVLVHDAARPCLSSAALQRLLAHCEQDSDRGAVLALPADDALKIVQGECVADTVARDNVWAMQTPQLFRAGLLKRALRQYPHAADEAEAALHCGATVNVVEGERQNIKITYAADVEMANALLHGRALEAAAR